MSVSALDADRAILNRRKGRMMSATRLIWAKRPAGDSERRRKVEAAPRLYLSAIVGLRNVKSGRLPWYSSAA